MGDFAVTMSPFAAGSVKVHRETTCVSACTNNFLGPVHVFGSFLHMHNVGQQIYTTRTTASGTTTIVNRIDYWNNGFQQVCLAAGGGLWP